jgi:hypothetical protein
VQQRLGECRRARPHGRCDGANQGKNPPKTARKAALCLPARSRECCVCAEIVRLIGGCCDFGTTGLSVPNVDNWRGRSGRVLLLRELGEFENSNCFNNFVRIYPRHPPQRCPRQGHEGRSDVGAAGPEQHPQEKGIQTLSWSSTGQADTWGLTHPSQKVPRTQ